MTCQKYQDRLFGRKKQRAKVSNLIQVHVKLIQIKYVPNTSQARHCLGLGLAWAWATKQSNKELIV